MTRTNIFSSKQNGKIVNNYSSVKQAGLCGELELYICEQFSINKSEEVTPYAEIYTNIISNQVKVLRRFEQMVLKREEMLMNILLPCDPLNDPLFSLLESSNG